MLYTHTRFSTYIIESASWRHLQTNFISFYILLSSAASNDLTFVDWVDLTRETLLQSRQSMKWIFGLFVGDDGELLDGWTMYFLLNKKNILHNYHQHECMRVWYFMWIFFSLRIGGFHPFFTIYFCSSSFSFVCNISHHHHHHQKHQ